MANHPTLIQCMCWLVSVYDLDLYVKTADTDSVSVLLVIMCDPDLKGKPYDTDSVCVGLC